MKSRNFADGQAFHKVTPTPPSCILIGELWGLCHGPTASCVWSLACRKGGAVVHIPVVFCPGVSNISALKKALWCFLCTLSFEKLWFRILGLEDEKKKTSWDCQIVGSYWIPCRCSLRNWQTATWTSPLGFGGPFKSQEHGWARGCFLLSALLSPPAFALAVCSDSRNWHSVKAFGVFNGICAATGFDP